MGWTSGGDLRAGLWRVWRVCDLGWEIWFEVVSIGLCLESSIALIPWQIGEVHRDVQPSRVVYI